MGSRETARHRQRLFGANLGCQHAPVCKAPLGQPPREGLDQRNPLCRQIVRRAVDVAIIAGLVDMIVSGRNNIKPDVQQKHRIHS